MPGGEMATECALVSPPWLPRRRLESASRHGLRDQYPASAHVTSQALETRPKAPLSYEALWRGVGRFETVSFWPGRLLTGTPPAAANQRAPWV